MTQLTRRQALAATASLPLASALPGLAAAEAPLLGPSFARHRRFTLGAFEVTTILAGTRPVEDPQTIFGTNVSREDFVAVSDAHFLSPDVTQFFFTPVVVNTGSELVLFDTGLNAAGTVTALAEAGYTADQIDTVVLTHMHGDHIGGLQTPQGPTFPNASYATGQIEFDSWASAGNDNFEAAVRPLADRMTFLDDGDRVVRGITGEAAFGHTPGHMVFRIESDNEQLLITGDLANHAVWSLANPDWQVRFDADAAAAALSRRRILDMLATDRIPAAFYHLPFPAIGFVEADRGNFRFVPEAGQLVG
ncbi:MAG: MBL fold metallo-hydrolase, partial [Pseudomonadota bacterium]